MRMVVVSEFVSLDGVMEDPSWTFQFASEEQERFKFDELTESDTLLLGRITYEGFAAAWPNMLEQYEGPRRAVLGDYADMMNGYPGVSPEESVELFRVLPNAELGAAPGADHSFIEARAGLFDALALDFLVRHRNYSARVPR